MTDLKQEKASFRLVGTVAPLGGNSLQSASLNKKNTWHTVNTTFGVDIDGSGNVVYPRLFGGHSSQGKPILCRPASVAQGEEYKMVEIPLEDRNNEELYKNISSFDILTSNISGTERKFISMVDFVEHLREHLIEGMEIVVYGNVEYTTPDVQEMDKVYRNYNVTSVRLNKTVEDKETGETKLALEHGTQLLQTYLFTEDSLPSDWKTQIKNNKEVVIGCFVPQYVSTVKDKHSGNYIKYGHTIAMPQAIVARHGETPDQFIKRLDGLFKVKGSDSIRKMQVQTRINEGYTTSTAEVEISKELQALIDDGLFDIEQVKSDVVVRGQRTRELVIVRTVLMKNDDTGEAVAFVDDEYEYSVLQVPKPKVESDSDFNTIKTKDKDVSVDDIDEFNDEFSSEDDDNFLDGLF